MCRLCERTGGFKPHAIHLFLCERCGHHKLLHGKRRTPMTKYEAALKIQKAWRIKAARKFHARFCKLAMYTPLPNDTQDTWTSEDES